MLSRFANFWFLFTVVVEVRRSETKKGMKGFTSLLTRFYVAGRAQKPSSSLLRGGSAYYLYSPRRVVSSASIPLSFQNQWTISQNPYESWVSAPWIGFGGETLLYFPLWAYLFKKFAWAYRQIVRCHHRKIEVEKIRLFLQSKEPRLAY